MNLKHLAATVLAAGVSVGSQATSNISPSHSFAYGANIGWINWHPSVANGAVVGQLFLSGHLWSANCGWISLGSGSPANGFRYQNNGAADLGEYLADTDPTDPSDQLRLTHIVTNSEGAKVGLTWTSKLSRCYVIQKSENLLNGSWADSASPGLVSPDVGPTTSRVVVAPPAERQFYRVRSVVPGADFGL